MFSGDKFQILCRSVHDNNNKTAAAAAVPRGAVTIFVEAAVFVVTVVAATAPIIRYTNDAQKQ